MEKAKDSRPGNPVRNGRSKQVEKPKVVMTERLSKIEFIHEQYPSALYMARKDEAIVTGKPFVEKPWYFKHSVTGQFFYDLYGCLGWPTEITDTDAGLPGYIAVLGIIKPGDAKEFDPVNASFQLLGEYESQDVPQLISKCVELRKEFGFGTQPHLLTVWYGDPRRFLRVLALKNELLTRQTGERGAVMVTPPDDLYTEKIFDNYVRAIRTAILSKRLFFGPCEIIRNRLREFARDDPAIMAVGGLIHTLLTRTIWMQTIEETAFSVEDAV